MDNNEILISLRYALDIKDEDMVRIFKLGGFEINNEEVQKMLFIKEEIKDNQNETLNDLEEKEESLKCDNIMLESFLNGLIILKRGKQEPKPGQPERPVLAIKDNGSVNNVMLKKLKIALTLESEDMIEIFEEAGVSITKGELSSLFRKEGQKHYKKCGNKYAKSFLDGLAIKCGE